MKAPIEACKLLTGEEIEKILGEPLREATASGQPQAGMAVSQCYFQLPTANKSISLAVWQPAKGQRRQPEEFWRERFHGESEEGEREEKEGHEIKPEPVSGLGDEAYWSGTGIGGALYVRKGNRFFRIGIGGSDNQETRVRKTRGLAESILPRF